MNQLRLDPLTGRWVVVSIDRAERPDNFAPRTAPVQADTSVPCPFCVGNEGSAPPALETYGSSGTWLVRVVPNLYPAFSGDRLSDEQAGLVMAAIRDRIEEHSNVPGLRYSQAIVNAGREAGASIEHPHGQLLGMSFVPRELAEEQAGFARFAGRCLLCTTVDAEEDAGYRVVYADDRVLVICPFWSGTPFEMLVIPRTHGPHLHRSSPADLMAVGRGDVAYNLVFHSAPYRAPEPYHWHVHIWPKLTTQAGFELGTGVLINIVAPEQASEELRVAVPAR
jgi:UDPglucose--hexose-1-phosphate uridylyltransferase